MVLVLQGSQAAGKAKFRCHESCPCWEALQCSGQQGKLPPSNSCDISSVAAVEVWVNPATSCVWLVVHSRDLLRRPLRPSDALVQPLLTMQGSCSTDAAIDDVIRDLVGWFVSEHRACVTHDCRGCSAQMHNSTQRLTLDIACMRPDTGSVSALGRARCARKPL